MVWAAKTRLEYQIRDVASLPRKKFRACALKGLATRRAGVTDGQTDRQTQPSQMIASMRRQLQDGNVDEGVYNTIPPIFGSMDGTSQRRKFKTEHTWIRRVFAWQDNETEHLDEHFGPGTHHYFCPNACPSKKMLIVNLQNPMQTNLRISLATFLRRKLVSS